MATEKQKAAARNIVENHGNVSAAMRKAGYSKQTAKNPSNLTNSKGYQEAIEELVPDKKSTRIHNSLLNARLMRTYNFEYTMPDDVIRKVIRSIGGKLIYTLTKEPGKGKGKNKFEGSKIAYYSVPDQRIVDSALDKLLKTKGVYTTNVKVDKTDWKDGLTDDQLRRLAHGESPESVLGQ